jgi:hypothetical protein
MDLHQLTTSLIAQNYNTGNYSGRFRFLNSWSEIETRNEEFQDTQRYNSLFPAPGSEGNTGALLYCTFWQIVTESQFFDVLLQNAKLYDPIAKGGRLILSMNEVRNKISYDLLILSPEIQSQEAISVPLKHLLPAFVSSAPDWPTENFFQQSLDKWFLRREQEWSQPVNIPMHNSHFLHTTLINKISKFGGKFVEHTFKIGKSNVIFAPMPKLTYNSGLASSALGISLYRKTDPISSAGVVCQSGGRFGVTASLHGVVEDPNSVHDMFNQFGSSCVVGKEVFVNGQKGIIQFADLITDSCFIEMDKEDLPKVAKNKGPLIGRPPYRREKAWFNGVISNKQETVVTEVDITIPFVARGNQAKVYTQAVVNPGDSGSALVNNEDQLLGFSHSRTGLGESIEFAEWIWADSVYSALNLYRVIS